MHQGRRIRYATVAGLIVQFSAIPQFVPYLAPALFAYAGYCLIRVLRHSWPVKQTRVLTEYGEHVIALPHLDSVTASRVRFEEQLKAAIESSRAKHDE
jgi:hypothetical protein